MEVPPPLRKAWTLLYNNALVYLIPKRKTVVRASIISIIGLLPLFLALFMHAPLRMSLFAAAVGGAFYLLGFGGDVFKQLRWMKRLSGQGPIFWATARFHRMLVHLGRRHYGDKLDSMPVVPAAFGVKTRGAERVTLKWIPQVTSSFSTEKYELLIRPTPTDSANAEHDDDESSWVALSEGIEGNELVLQPLVANVSYDAKIRAVNSKGASDWIHCSFITKQRPTKSDDGERAGAEGPGYTWQQHLKGESLHVTIGPLPAGTRAKMLDVKVAPTTLRIALNGTVLVEGDFFAPVASDDTEWELGDKADSKERELLLTLLKAGEKGGPFWPSLLKGHPEMDVSGLKRKEKDLDELMAEINSSEAMRGMALAEEVKKKL